MADQQIQEQPSASQLKEEYYQVNTADGNTIVLTSEQLQQMQMQDGMMAVAAEQDENQQFVEGIIDNGEEEVHEEQEEMILDHQQDPSEEVETQQVHIDADGNIISQPIEELHHETVTYHSVDAEGNLITADPVENGETVEMTEQVEIPMDQSGIENMVDTENIVEEVISSTNHEEEETYLTPDNINATNQDQDVNNQFLNVQEAIFNPETGTLQPINAVTTSAPVVQPTVVAPKPIVKKVTKVSTPQQVVTTKYVLQQTGGDLGQGQTIIMDPSQLQGIIQGGGSITLGAAGKNILIAPPASKQKLIAPKSPAKILPAPIPSGDQQQGGAPKLMIKPGNILAPLNQPPDKFLAVHTGVGNQVQYVRVVHGKQHIAPLNKVPIAPATIKPKPVAPKPSPGHTILLPGTSTADMSTLQTSGLGNFVVLPTNYIVKSEPTGPIPIRPAEPISSGLSHTSITDTSSFLSGFTSLPSAAGNTLDSIRSLLEPNGMRPRKPCNCTKSQCLKLYCDCFANGEFCHLCNCTNCFNNLQHEEDRQKAIKLVLERNPGAFRPKIGKSSQTGEAHERRHNKGCNCRRSGCLKNYCECYEAKIFCSGICKCTGCKNCIENIPSGLPNGVGVEQHFAGAGTAHRQTLKDLAEAAEVRVQQQTQVKNKMRAQMQEVSAQNNLGIMVPPIVFRYPHSTISYEVVTATVELLLAKAEACEKQRMTEGEIEREVLEEFGDCLASVMELGSTVE